MIVVAYFLTFSCLILIASLFVHLKPPYSFYLAFSLQLAAVALSPCWWSWPSWGRGLGGLYHAPIAVGAGLLAAAIAAIYIARVTAPQPGFELAFGKDWESRIPACRAAHMLKRRWNLRLAAHRRAALGAGHTLLDDPRYRPEAVVRYLAAAGRRAPERPGLCLSAWQRVVDSGQGFRHAAAFPAPGRPGARDHGRRLPAMSRKWISTAWSATSNGPWHG